MKKLKRSLNAAATAPRLEKYSEYESIRIIPQVFADLPSVHISRLKKILNRIADQMGVDLIVLNLLMNMKTISECYDFENDCVLEDKCKQFIFGDTDDLNNLSNVIDILFKK